MTFEIKEARILIIDDQLPNTQLLENFLALNGFKNYRSLNDSRQALELIESFQPDLLLLDIMMPFIDGFEILDSLLKQGKLASPLRVMVLTADATKEALVKVLRSGAHDMLRKPFDLVELELRIRNLLHTNALLKQLNDETNDLAYWVGKRTEELIQKNAELEQFIYVASHDTQEPLRMITGFLNLIQKKYGQFFDEKGLEYINFAIVGADRMKRLIKEMLYFSIADKDLSEQFEYIDLNDALDDILTLLQRNIRNTDAEIRVEKLPIVKGVYAPVRQIFQNIISNALIYQPKNQKPIINVRSENDELETRIYISDNGLGISNEDQHKIFDIFTRLHRREDFEGTGLGLSLAKKLIEKMGGRISLNSELGKGSEFCVHFLKQETERLEQ